MSWARLTLGTAGPEPHVHRDGYAEAGGAQIALTGAALHTAH